MIKNAHHHNIAAAIVSGRRFEKRTAKTALVSQFLFQNMITTSGIRGLFPAGRLMGAEMASKLPPEVPRIDAMGQKKWKP
jgi:hypothetical protein